MMKLDKITISNIFNLGKVEIALDDLTALVAPNNYGKSNVLEAVKFGVRFIEVSNKRKSSWMNSRDVIPINTALEGKPFGFQIEGSFEEGGKTCSFDYGYSFVWAKTLKDDQGARIVSEYLRMKSEDDLKYRSYISRDNRDVALYLASQTGRCSKQLPLEGNMLALNKLANFDDLFYIGALRALNEIDVHEIRTLDDPDNYFNMISPDEDVNELSLNYPRDAKVGFYVNCLKEKAPDKYEMLKDAVRSLLPTIVDFEPVQINLRKEDEPEDEKSLPFRLPETFYDVRVRELYNNQCTSINRISSGSKRIFFVLTLVMAAEINKVPLIMLEELENSVHPKLLQNLLTAVSELAGDTKVLITSHSPYLVKYLDPSHIRFGMPSSAGVADFRAIRPNKIKKVLRNASAEEVSTGEYLFELMLDMEDDGEMLEEYFV